MHSEGLSRGPARAAACGRAVLLYLWVCVFTASARGADEDGGGCSAKSRFCFGIAACTGSRLGFVLAHSPTQPWPGAQTKAEPGPRTTLLLREGEADPEPGSFHGATLARSDDLP